MQIEKTNWNMFNAYEYDKRVKNMQHVKDSTFDSAKWSQKHKKKNDELSANYKKRVG